MFLSAKILSFSLVFRNCNYYNKLVIELRVRPSLLPSIVIKQIEFALRAHPILLMTLNITDRIGIRSVLLPLITYFG